MGGMHKKLVTSISVVIKNERSLIMPIYIKMYEINKLSVIKK